MGIILQSLGIDESDPEVVAAMEDFDDFAELIRALIARRKALGLTQAEVANAMHTGQSAVSALEAIGGNPSIRRLQRYARAVGMRLSIGAETQPVGSPAGWVGSEVRESARPVRPSKVPGNVIRGPWKSLTERSAGISHVS